MRRSFAILLLLLAGLTATATASAADATNELAVARAALRDGLWEIARAHAARIESPDAAAIVIESFAREGRWSDVLAKLATAGTSADERFAYYRAEALYRTGDAALARTALDGTTFTRPPLVRAAGLLRAEMALAAGDPAAAREALKGLDATDTDVKMLAADVRKADGDRAGACRLWREVASDTNAAERAAVTAAVNLGDAALLSNAVRRAASPDLRRAAYLRLARVLIEKRATFADGERLLRKTVRDAPDAPGAREAHLALAERRLFFGDDAGAAADYATALEMWPALAKDASVQEGLGWAHLRLGQTDKALAAFTAAEECAQDDETRAAAAVKVADTLAKAGRDAEATERYRVLVEKYPATHAATTVSEIVQLRDLEARGRALYHDYRFAEAQEAFAKVAQRSRAHAPQMRFYVALCLYGQGHDKEAEQSIRSLAAAPDASNSVFRSEATLWLAKFSYNRGNWDEAERLFSAYADSRSDAHDAPASLLWAARAALADNDFVLAVSNVTRLATRYPAASETVAGLLVQGEALIELGRFDEAVLILERASLAPSGSAADHQRAQLLKADALFAMGADNPVHYATALEAYRGLVRDSAADDPSHRLALAFKIARTLDKLRRTDEAIDHCYTQVVFAYSDGRSRGLHFDDESRALFARAAFWLADEFEGRGRGEQAARVLALVTASDSPAAGEAARRIEKIRKKGLLP